MDPINTPTQGIPQQPPNIQDLFKITATRNASDLHIVAGYSPSIRLNREMCQLSMYPALTSEDTARLLLPLLTEEQRQKLLMYLEFDCSISTPEGLRFRANFYFQQKSLAATFRHVHDHIRTIDELKLPTTFHTFTHHEEGLILFTGPTGEGKSTSLAALIHEINTQHSKHIITIEDPIEYIFPKGKGVVSQRELGLDTKSWPNALKGALRQDPDIILLGEMRDYDTVSAALTAAETGHLVFSTLHTSSSSETISRIVDVFPSHQQSQVRSQLASVLRVVVTQRLLPTTIESQPLIPAIEVLQNSQAVSALIREGKTFMLDSALETGDEQGMVLFEKYLARLVREGIITRITAAKYANKPMLLNKYINS
jgi:twitching motility protein PilT